MDLEQWLKEVEEADKAEDEYAFNHPDYYPFEMNFADPEAGDEDVIEYADPAIYAEIYEEREFKRLVGKGYNTIATISKKMQCNKRTANKIKDRLIGKGLIKVKPIGRDHRIYFVKPRHNR